MSSGHQRIKWRRNIAENFNRLSRVHERYRRQTDGRTMTYSEHEHEFTFAKNRTVCPFARLGVGMSNGRNANHVTLPAVCDHAALRPRCRFPALAFGPVGLTAVPYRKHARMFTQMCKIKVLPCEKQMIYLIYKQEVKGCNR